MSCNSSASHHAGADQAEASDIAAETEITMATTAKGFAVDDTAPAFADDACVCAKKAGTSVSTAGNARGGNSLLCLHAGSRKIELPIELIGGVCQYIDDRQGVAFDVMDHIESDDEEETFWNGYLHRNFSALEQIYLLSLSSETREQGREEMEDWMRANEDFVDQCSNIPADLPLGGRAGILGADGRLVFYPANLFRSPVPAINMDDLGLLQHVVANGPWNDISQLIVSVETTTPSDGTVASKNYSYGVVDLLSLSYRICGSDCFKWMLDKISHADPSTLVSHGKSGFPLATCILSEFVRRPSKIANSPELNLLSFLLNHRVCDVNALSSTGGHAPLFAALGGLIRPPRDNFQNHVSRSLVGTALFVKAGADIDGGHVSPQVAAILLTVSGDEAAVARGVLALEVLHRRLLVDDSISDAIAKADALAGILSFI